MLDRDRLRPGGVSDWGMENDPRLGYCGRILDGRLRLNGGPPGRTDAEGSPIEAERCPSEAQWSLTEDWGLTLTVLDLGREFSATSAQWRPETFSGMAAMDTLEGLFEVSLPSDFVSE